MSNTKAKKAKNKKQFWVRVVCIVLCVLLAGSAVASVIVMLFQ